MWEFTYREDDPIYCFITSIAPKVTIRITDQIHGAGGLPQPGLPGLQRVLGAWTGSLGHVLPHVLDPSSTERSQGYQINCDTLYANSSKISIVFVYKEKM